MDAETLRKVHMVEKEILDEVVRVCDKNNISYFLMAGTLLGAVRHKGFIPWDDDIDVGMTYDNFKRFIEIAPRELNDKYFLQTWKNDNEYPFAAAKVRKKGTLFAEVAAKNTKYHNEFL